jgi:hypothetical protein
MVPKMLPGSMKIPFGESTHNFLNKFEILISILYMHKDSAKIRGRGCNTPGFEPPL